MIRSLILSALVLIFLIVGLWSLRGEILILIFPVLIYLSVQYLLHPGRIELSVTRELSSLHLIHGQSLDVKLRITNRGDALDEVLLEDLIPGRFTIVSGSPVEYCSMKPGETIELRYTLQVVRGEYRLAGVNVGITDHFGLFQSTRLLKHETRVTVTPQAMKLKKVVIRPWKTQVYAGTIPTRVGGTGIDYFGMREYTTGDSPRLINWKAMARHENQLFTNEFEQERMANIGLIFDCRKSSYTVEDPQLFLDHIAPAAVELANSLLRDGNRVGLLVYGAFLDWTHLGAGKIHRERIARTIAKIELKENQVFKNLGQIPTRLFPAQSQLIIFSPLLKNDLESLMKLQSRGYQIIVISPNPILFDEESIPKQPDRSLAERILNLERELLIKKIRQTGIRLIDWDLSIPFHQVVAQSLNRQSESPFLFTRAI